jgi:hypothetical protein
MDIAAKASQIESFFEFANHPRHPEVHNVWLNYKPFPS